MKITPTTPPKNGGIVPPWLLRPWPVPVAPDTPVIFEALKDEARNV